MYDGVGSRVANPPLELENIEKIWNVQFQIWIWKWTAADRNSGNFFQIPKKIWNFSPVKTALYLIRIGSCLVGNGKYTSYHRSHIQLVYMEQSSSDSRNGGNVRAFHNQGLKSFYCSHFSPLLLHFHRGQKIDPESEDRGDNAA